MITSQVAKCMQKLYYYTLRGNILNKSLSLPVVLGFMIHDQAFML